MAEKVTGSYIGDLKCRLTHITSGSEIDTAAPLDNQGDGSTFSPTDLVGAALGSCILTTIAIVAKRRDIKIESCSFEVIKEMNADPRRIGRLPVAVHLPSSLPQEQRVILERAALACPVHRSLHPDIEAPVTFNYDL